MSERLLMRTTFLLFTAALLVDGRDEDGLESEVAALLPGLMACSGGAGSAMGPAQRLRAEAVRDVQVCCVREDVLERVDEVVVPASGGGSPVTLTRAALFDNVAAQPDGRYACIAMVRNRTSGAQGSEANGDGRVTIVGKPSRVELEVLDEHGGRYDDGDRILVLMQDTLVLRYRYAVSADATLLEQVSGEEPWRRPVMFSSKTSSVRRHEGTLVLWEVSRAVAVFVQVALHSRPPLTKSVMLNLVIVPQLAVGMACLEDVDCRSVNGLCMERQCKCVFSLDINGTCVVVGCERNEECARVPGTVCVESTCQCPTGSELRNGRCRHRACRNHFECARERLHTVCFRNSCLCTHGHRDVDGSCTPIDCFHDIECRDPLMICRNATCQCSDGHVDCGERCEPTRGRARKCLADGDCKWSDLCLNRRCVCHRESSSGPGVCLEADLESSTDALGTTSAHKLFAAATGIGIFLVTSAGLVLFLASLSKKEGIDVDTAPGIQAGGEPPIDHGWPSEDPHEGATTDGVPCTHSVTATDSQCSLDEDVVVHDD
ncbi:uncharacterized protein LOC144109532 [Amblyomma americanum]